MLQYVKEEQKMLKKSLIESPFQNSDSYEVFSFKGRNAGIVYPKTPQTDGRWAMYTEYFGAFPVVAEELLLRGYCLIRFDNTNRWGLDIDSEFRWDFADFLEKEMHLSHVCALIGMSCGGLQAIKFAAIHPDRIVAMYLDAPVVNLLSCPFAYGSAKRDESMAQECMHALSMDEKAILSYRKHPLDYLPILQKASIPIAMVYGDADYIVPYEENGLLIEQRWLSSGIPFIKCCKHNCGHHPHGPNSPMETADFIDKWFSVHP